MSSKACLSFEYFLFTTASIECHTYFVCLRCRAFRYLCRTWQWSDFPFLAEAHDGAPCSSAFRWDTVSHRGERVDSPCFDRPLTLDCIEDGGTSTWIIALMTLCSVSSISGISKKNPPWLAAFKSPSFIQTCSYVALHSLILCQTHLRGEKLKVSAFTLFHIDRSNEFLFFWFPSQIHQTPKTCQEQHCWESWF